MKYTLVLFSLSVLVLGIIAARTHFRSLEVKSDNPLYIGWEGIVKDKNFRDIGQSINDCAKSKLMREGVLYRANQWFSGWSCESIANPDVIFSLNYDPKSPMSFYCTDPALTRVGVNVNQSTELNDLEFLQTWEIPEQRFAACRYLKSIITAVADRKRVLLHCEAGRDRTGAVSALLSGLVLEKTNLPETTQNEILECDYRKSKSIRENKFGRIDRFSTELRKNGGISNFMQTKCEIDASEIQKFLEVVVQKQ